MATSQKNQMMTSIKGSDFLYDLVCKPCHFDDISKPAFGYCTDCNEHLCSMCYVNHKKLRPSRHHKLLDSSSMPITQTLDDTDTSVDEGPHDGLTTPCEKHSEEYIKFYCNDHKMTLCSVCVTLNHNKDCKVDYIPDISRNVLDSNRLREMISRANTVELKCSTVKERISRDTQQTIKYLKKSMSDMKEFKSDIIRTLEIHENEISKKIHELLEQIDDEEKSTITLCDGMKTDIILKKDTLNQMNEAKQQNQLFIELPRTSKLLGECQDNLQLVERKHIVYENQFIPNEAIQDLLKDGNALGMLIPVQTIFVKTQEDESECRITGIIEISKDTLVLTDKRNHSIKLVDGHSKSVKSTLTLAGGPWDITAISSTEVAVTVPDDECVLFVTVSNNLEESRRINTNGYCYGICYHQDKLIVTYCNFGALEILDMEGKVMKRISEGKFTMPFYVLATNDFIYVTDTRNILKRFDWIGNLIPSDVDIRSTRGIAMLKDRNSLLICSYTNNRIYEISEDFKEIKFILPNVECPQAICVNHQQNKIYISMDTGRVSKTDISILVWNI